MTVAIREKGSEAFYREVITVSSYYRYLLKNHSRKIKDPIKEYTILLAVCATAFTLLLICTTVFGLGILEAVGLTGLFLASLLSALLLFRLIKVKKALLADPRTATLTLDDSGVSLNKENTQEMHVGWGSVAFVRVLQEGIHFVSDLQTGFVISVSRLHEKEVLPWLREHRPELEIIYEP